LSRSCYGFPFAEQPAQRAEVDWLDDVFVEPRMERELAIAALAVAIKGENAAIAAKAATYLTQQGQFTTSAVTVTEIVHGFRARAREDRVNPEAGIFIWRAGHFHGRCQSGFEVARVAMTVRSV
jgi:hypothetical protein